MNEKDYPQTQAGLGGIIIKVILMTVMIGVLIVSGIYFNFQLIIRDVLHGFPALAHLDL